MEHPLLATGKENVAPKEGKIVEKESSIIGRDDDGQSDYRGLSLPDAVLGFYDLLVPAVFGHAAAASHAKGSGAGRQGGSSVQLSQ